MKYTPDAKAKMHRLQDIAKARRAVWDQCEADRREALEQLVDARGALTLIRDHGGAARVGLAEAIERQEAIVAEADAKVKRAAARTQQAGEDMQAARQLVERAEVFLTRKCGVPPSAIYR
ncbi:hypothetical protein [Caenispirillum bisanense]|uniref:hypothetical protein n=1 Tax=Caenispirillum bisanense TaxID=414052 RepID=UPI0031D77D66